MLGLIYIHFSLYSLTQNSQYLLLSSMLNQFTEEYKAIMLAAENTAKSRGYNQILPEDVLVEISKIKEGNIYDLFSSFGLNQKIIMDVLSRPPFHKEGEVRTGDYIGISERVKGLIVMSMKVAASFQKTQASVEDFLLAMFRVQDESWFYQFLDFVGISPKDFESQVVEINTLIAGVGQSEGQ